MSPSLRQFMIISVVGMTMLVVLLLYFHVDLSEDYLETHLDTHNQNLAIVLRNSLLAEGLEKALMAPEEGLSLSLKKHFNTTLERDMRWVPVVKVKVYSKDGRVLYSSKADEIGGSARENRGVQASLAGESMSGLVHRNRVNDFDQTVELLSLHQQYIPITHSGSGEILGAFEIYTDITGILAHAEQKQKTIFWLIGGSLLLFYLALAFSFLGTHRLLRRETRQRMAHLEELQDIRADLEHRVAARTSELDKSKQFLQSIIDGIGNPLMVIRPDHSIALMNNAAKQNIPPGQDASQVLRCYQVSHQLDQPCTDPNHPCAFSQVMEHGCTARVRHTHYDENQQLVLLDLVTTPLYSAEGEFEGVIEVQHDITRLVQMQSGLEQSEARLQAIMNNVPDAILTCDSEYIIQSINPAAKSLFNANESDLVGRSFNSLFSDNNTSVRLTPGNTGQSDALMQRLKGQDFSADIWIGPLDQGEGENSYIAVVRDITRRIQAQKELEATRQQFFHQEKMAAIGHLAAGILHEVGNPIAAIAGAATDLKTISINGKQSANDCPFDHDVSENIDMINEQTTRLSKITREIADFASPKPRERELLDLNGLLNSTARLLAYDQRFREINIDLQLDSSLPAIWGVADQLTQVFMNLLLNAMDACLASDNQDHRIQLRTRLDDDRVAVIIEDNGTGINSDTLDHVLEPFYTTKPVGKGSGLGLSLCDTIVLAHGGKLDLQSEWGEGTRVTVQLPFDIPG